MPDEVTHKLCIDQPRVYQTMSCIDAVFRMLQSQVLGQDITGRTSRFFVGHVTLSPRPSPSVFILQTIKNWSRETAWERGYLVPEEVVHG